MIFFGREIAAKTDLFRLVAAAAEMPECHSLARVARLCSAQKEKPTGTLPVGQTKTLSAALPRFPYTIVSSLLSVCESSASALRNTLGSPQCLAPAEQVSR